MKRFFLLSLIIVVGQTLAQQPELLDEVILTADTSLQEFSEAQNVIKLNDSILKKNPASLTALLNFNTPIYFKENGAGMVSSPSFRGTTASQTAVIWNGININSLSTGQTDFNTINTRGFDQISIKAGGGSNAYGSSAIGGTVHLINKLAFATGDKTREIRQNLYASCGSFNAYETAYSAKIASKKTGISLGINRQASDNDYPIHGKGYKNTNGQFENHGLNAAFALKLSTRNTLQYYGQYYDGERHFSVISPNAAKTKYRDTNTRNLVVWNSDLNQFTSTLKMAYLREEYRYFPNIESPNFTHGTFDSKLAQYILLSQLSKKMQWQLSLDYIQSQGKGSDIAATTQESGSANLMLKHRFIKNAHYEVSLSRKFSAIYQSVWLYSIGTQINITRFYSIKAHFSKNYRTPTFNDLYWPGSGNLDLLPETAYQYELSQSINFPSGNIQVTGYYNDIYDLLRWIPVSGSLWKPENTGRVIGYGIEISTRFRKKIGKSSWELSGNYAYAVSENHENQRQLIYVPFHKANASLSGSFNRFLLYHRYLYTGTVYTTSDHNIRLDAYQLVDSGIIYTLSNDYTIGFQINNIFNTAYSNVLNRPMPGRNYNFYINLNF